MGFAGISLPQLLIVLAIVILIFGSKRIRQLGQDAGEMIRGFRSGFKELDDAEPDIQELKQEFNNAKDTIRRLER